MVQVRFLYRPDYSHYIYEIDKIANFFSFHYHFQAKIFIANSWNPF